jgi:ATP-binding cassette subfamily C (CFTR/MRP) protein 1
MLRGALISIIFSKITDLALGAVEDSAAVTLMSTDIDSIATGLVQMHEIWATPIELGIGIYCLQRQVGLACMLVTIPAMGTSQVYSHKSLMRTLKFAKSG